MKLSVGIDPGQDLGGIACELRDHHGDCLHRSSVATISGRRGQWWPDYAHYVKETLPSFALNKELEMELVVMVEYTGRFAKVWGGGMCVAYEVLRQLYPVNYFKHRKAVKALTPPAWRKIFRETHQVSKHKKGEEKQWAVDNATRLWESVPTNDNEAEARLLCECGFLL